MAKALMSRPYMLSSTLRQASLTSPHTMKPRFFSSAILSPVKPETNTKTHLICVSVSESNTASSACIRGKIGVKSGNHGNRRVPMFGFGPLVVGNRMFSAGATSVNDAGSIDSSLMKSMEKKIKEQLNADLVVVKDVSGDGRHVCIDVVSSAFEGQSAVNRQRMVYKAIWEELQNVVHAVDQMTTKTPTEAAGQK